MNIPMAYRGAQENRNAKTRMASRRFWGYGSPSFQFFCLFVCRKLLPTPIVARVIGRSLIIAGLFAGRIASRGSGRVGSGRPGPTRDICNPPD